MNSNRKNLLLTLCLHNVKLISKSFVVIFYNLYFKSKYTLFLTDAKTYTEERQN